MSLQRAKQMLQEYYSRLGIDYPPQDWVLNLIDQVMGGPPKYKTYLMSVAWINHKHCPVEIINSVDRRDFREILEMNSYDVDPEEIVQEIISNIVLKGLNGWTANLLLLRDYLVHRCGLFKRYILNSEEWKEKYRIHLEDIHPPVPEQLFFTPHRFLFKHLDDRLTVFDRYLLYLKCILGLSDMKVMDILQIDKCVLVRYRNTFVKKLKELSFYE